MNNMNTNMITTTTTTTTTIKNCYSKCDKSTISIRFILYKCFSTSSVLNSRSNESHEEELKEAAIREQEARDAATREQEEAAIREQVLKEEALKKEYLESEAYVNGNLGDIEQHENDIRDNGYTETESKKITESYHKTEQNVNQALESYTDINPQASRAAIECYMLRDRIVDSIDEHHQNLYSVGNQNVESDTDEENSTNNNSLYESDDNNSLYELSEIGSVYGSDDNNSENGSNDNNSENGSKDNDSENGSNDNDSENGSNFPSTTNNSSNRTISSKNIYETSHTFNGNNSIAFAHKSKFHGFLFGKNTYEDSNSPMDFVVDIQMCESYNIFDD